MEVVHQPLKRSWIDDSVVCVRDFCKQMSLTLLSENGDLKSDDETNIRNQVSRDEFNELEKMCGLETLKCDFQERVEMASSINLPTEMPLDTLRFQEDDLTKRRECNKYAFIVYNSTKFNNFPPHKNLGTITGIKNDIPFEPVIMPEVILSVQMYKPMRRSDMRIPVFHVVQELLVLGSQFLTELRDKIDCVSDKAIPGDYSDCPLVEPTETCKDLFKSGFFYINGTFYNDMRDPDCRDYSHLIMKWAEDTNRGIGPFRKALMEKSRFMDLRLNLGYPYVYVHQGECEHLLVFSDLRFFSKHEDQNKNAYPLFVSAKPPKHPFCMLCHIYMASWVVFDNKRLPENPFFFCKNCFLSFNYDADNKKIGNFRAYHFSTKFT